jgi:two-component system sensor histidine kinase KdpD
MNADRPDPDQLLERLKREEVAAHRGRLKIFFGAAAGVGKTYQMLEQAQARSREGTEVVVGWIETHGRAETARLLEGLEILPPLMVEYRGTRIPEFDLDAALRRKPRLLLVDELAHTNAPGSRHEKRWQDVEELLAAGIDVSTTVNVQHIESLNDVVAQVSGVTVRETIPDTVFERADEVELVDLSPEELLERLRQGKVYIPDQAARALERFFTKGNLIALRELSLRQMAQSVDTQVQSYKEEVGITEVLPVTERIIVCASPSPSARRVVRAARRMAAGLRAEWVVAYVEPTGRLHLSERKQELIASTLRLAEQLGAKTAVLHGPSVSEEILAYARRRNATKIVVGKPALAWWRYRLFGSVVDELVRRSGEVDVYVISGTGEEEAGVAPVRLRPSSPAKNYLVSVLVTGVATAAALALFPRLELANLVMIYLTGVLLVAARFGRGPSILASVLSVAAFDFLFVPPRFTFAVADTEYLITFLVMLAMGLLISSLVTRVRQHAELSREREERMAALYRMSRELSLAADVTEVVRIAEEKIGELLGTEVWILLPGEDGRLAPGPGVTSAFPLSERERGVAEWVMKHGKLAGEGTATLPGAGALYLPLIGSKGTVGVLGIFAPPGGSGWSADQMHLMEALASQMALVLERVALARDAQRAELASETEKLRNTVLSSVSHDLRTPLAAIAGAASSLLEDEAALDGTTRRDLLQSIWDESERLNRLVGNLLSISRLDAGELALRREWHPIEEIVGSALAYLERRLRGRRVELHVSSDVPLVYIDDVTTEQVLVNLLDNVLKYAPGDTPIEIRVEAAGGKVVVSVADRGPGIPEGQEEAIFHRFHRAAPGRPEGGFGLGLTICRGIVEAHGGRIWARNGDGGGAIVSFSLPASEKPL